MKRRRDSLSGRYLKIDESNQKDKSTWTEEKDFDKDKFLKRIFKILLKDSFEIEGNVEVIDVRDVEEIFSKYGMKQT